MRRVLSGGARRGARWAAVGGLALALVVPAPALEFLKTERYALPAGESAASDLWVAAQRIDIAGTAADDLFLLATAESFFAPDGSNGVIRIDGVCSNDVWALAAAVEMRGEIGDHARLAGRIVTLEGSVRNGAILAGTAVHVATGAVLGADAWLLGETVTMAGRVDGALRMTGQNVTLAGTCDGDVTIEAQDLVVLPGTRVAGDLRYRAPKELALDQTVSVGGAVVRLPESAPSPGGRGGGVSTFLVQAWLYLGALIVGVVFFRLFPRAGRPASGRLLVSFWKCLFAGFAALALGPFVCLAAAASLVGLPFAMLLAVCLMVAVYLSKIVMGLYLGHVILRGRGGAGIVIPLAVGLLPLYAGVQAGLLGAAVWITVACAGTGSLLLGLLERPAPASSRPPETTAAPGVDGPPA